MAWEIINHFKENPNRVRYLDGSIGGWRTTFPHGLLDKDSNLNPTKRYNSGFKKGSSIAAEIIGRLERDEDGKIIEPLYVVAHSMGSAYAKGFLQAIVNFVKEYPWLCNGLSVSEYDFASFQPEYQEAIEGVDTYQYAHYDDIVAGSEKFKGATYSSSFAGPMFSLSADPHSLETFKNDIESLPSGRYVFINGKPIKFKGNH